MHYVCIENTASFEVYIEMSNVVLILFSALYKLSYREKNNPLRVLYPIWGVHLQNVVQN